MMMETGIAPHKKSVMGNKTRTDRRNELETLLVSFVMAMVMALGILLFAIALLEIPLAAVNDTLFASLYAFVTVALFGMLILRNR